MTGGKHSWSALPRNRKGDLFMLTLDMLFFVAIIIIFWKLSAAFTQQNPNEGIGTRQAALLHTYAVSEQMLLYVDEAAKFAAYESLASIMAKGAQNQATPVCPDKYIDYPLWTTRAKLCFPQTKQKDGTSVYDNFETEMVINMRKYLKYPGFPAGIDYDIQTSGGNGLKVVGLTKDEVVLPIVVAKGSKQAEITPLLLQDNVAKARTDGAISDATVEGVTVELSDNRADRTGAIQYLIIRSTLTRNVIEAFSQYKEGGRSTHYIIDDKGIIYQVVPEAQQAMALDGCLNCRITDLENKAIIISLVNAGVAEDQLVENKCQDPENYILLSKKGWCDGKPCQKSYPQQCWDKFPDKQVQALEQLVIDVAHRNKIATKDILLEEQVRSTGGNPGPALFNSTIQGDQQLQWLAGLLSRVAVEAAAQEDVEGDAEIQFSSVNIHVDDQIGVIMPLDNPVITSCFGQRNVAGSQEHYGVDFRAPVGTPIRAIADGTITMMCDEWKGQCACSSRSATCPLTCRSLCQGRGQGYGNNVLIKHSNDLSSHYSHLTSINVKNGQQVKRGDIIGTSGNTGSSTAPHLHFTIFTGEFTSLAKQNADNPMCIYPDEQLRKIRLVGSNCGKYANGLTHADPVFANECSGIEPLKSAPACGLNVMPLDARGSERVARTVAKIKAIPELEANLLRAAEEHKIDQRLLVAQITQESDGDANLVSSVGALGISQFMHETAQEYFAGTPAVQACGCAATKSCTKYDPSCAATDVRRDPHKSVAAQAKLMATNIGKYDKYTDKIQFALAEYNWGGNVRVKAIPEAQKTTGKEDVRWEEVRPYVPEETKNYVDSILRMYVSQGGSVSNVFADMQCDDYNVKEIGTYAFSPAFSVTVPDLLTSFDRTIAWAQNTYNACNGVGGMDTRACLAENVQSFNRQSSDLEIISCENPQEQNLLSLRQAIDDCKNNKQDDCTCGWKPLNAEQLTIQLATVKDQLEVTQVTPRNHEDDLPTALVEMQQQLVKSVTITIDKKMNAQVSNPDGTSSIGYELTELRFRKDGNQLLFVPDRTSVPACGVYKTTHQICVQVKHEIPILSKGTELQTPEIKFALWFNDTHLPTANVQAHTYFDTGGIINYEITSPDKDISYYEITCALQGQQFAQTPQKISLARQDDKSIKVSDSLTSCGEALTQQGKYQLRVVPVDISGNKGAPVIENVKSYQEYVMNPTGAVLGTLMQP